jgi:hypothetical protein
VSGGAVMIENPAAITISSFQSGGHAATVEFD